jgi:hypothetical protein
MRRAVSIALAVVVATSLAIAGSASADAKTVVPFEGIQHAIVLDISAPVDGPGPLVLDHVSMRTEFEPLVQGGISLERVYDPETMRGTVTGTLGGTAATTLSGTLRGVISPDGMHGTFELTRTSDLDFPGLFYRIHGTWSSVGHPVEPTIGNLDPAYFITLDGVEIGTFRL